MITKPVLIDTRPLVAMLYEREHQHAACVEAAKQLPEKLLTCWPVITEAAYFAVPEEEPRSEGFTVDVGPSMGVDQEAEHVLLAAVKPGSSVHASLGRLEVRAELGDQVEQVRQ